MSIKIDTICTGCLKKFETGETIFSISSQLKKEFEDLTLCELRIGPLSRFCQFCLRSLQIATEIKERFVKKQVELYLMQQITPMETNSGPSTSSGSSSSSATTTASSQSTKNYKCQSCDKVYSTASGRHRHFNQDHKKLRYPCPLCETFVMRKDRSLYIGHLNRSHPELSGEQRENALAQFQKIKPIFLDQ